jgi:hypothetical protein
MLDVKGSCLHAGVASRVLERCHSGCTIRIIVLTCWLLNHVPDFGGHDAIHDLSF